MEDMVTAWSFVSEDQSEMLLSVVRMTSHFNAPIDYLRMKGLKEDAIYREETTGKEYTGSALMHAGIPLPMQWGEHMSLQMHFSKIS
jgi:alpha-galactosidase